MASVRKIYYSTADVAVMLGMTVSGARKWLRRNGGARKVGGRWKTTASRLAAAFPEEFQALAR